MMNPQEEKELKQATEALRNESIVILQNQTGWIAVADATKSKTLNAVQSVETHSSVFPPTVILDDASKLGKYLRDIPDPAWDLIEFTERPLFLGFRNVLNLPLLVNSSEQVINFSFPKENFLLQLSRKFGKPLYSIFVGEFSDEPPSISILNANTYVVHLRHSMKNQNKIPVVLIMGPTGEINFISK